MYWPHIHPLVGLTESILWFLGRNWWESKITENTENTDNYLKLQQRLCKHRYARMSMDVTAEKRVLFFLTTELRICR